MPQVEAERSLGPVSGQLLQKASLELSVWYKYVREARGSVLSRSSKFLLPPKCSLNHDVVVKHPDL